MWVGSHPDLAPEAVLGGLEDLGGGAAIAASALGPEEYEVASSEAMSVSCVSSEEGLEKLGDELVVGWWDWLCGVGQSPKAVLGSDHALSFVATAETCSQKCEDVFQVDSNDHLEGGRLSRLEAVELYNRVNPTLQVGDVHQIDKVSSFHGDCRLLVSRNVDVAEEACVLTEVCPTVSERVGLLYPTWLEFALIFTPLLVVSTFPVSSMGLMLVLFNWVVSKHSEALEGELDVVYCPHLLSVAHRNADINADRKSLISLAKQYVRGVSSMPLDSGMIDTVLDCSALASVVYRPLNFR